MSRQQIEWARQHDWFERATDNGHVVVCEILTRDGMTWYSYRTFKSFSALRAWAGY